MQWLQTEEDAVSHGTDSGDMPHGSDSRSALILPPPYIRIVDPDGQDVEESHANQGELFQDSDERRPPLATTSLL